MTTAVATGEFMGETPVILSDGRVFNCNTLFVTLVLMLDGRDDMLLSVGALVL